MALFVQESRQKLKASLEWRAEYIGNYTHGNLGVDVIRHEEECEQAIEQGSKYIAALCWQ